MHRLTSRGPYKAPIANGYEVTEKQFYRMAAHNGSILARREELLIKRAKRRVEALRIIKIARGDSIKRLVGIIYRN